MSNARSGGKYIQTDEGRIRASVAEIDLEKSVSGVLKQVRSMDLTDTDIQAVIKREQNGKGRSTLIRPLKKLIS